MGKSTYNLVAKSMEDSLAMAKEATRNLVPLSLVAAKVVNLPQVAIILEVSMVQATQAEPKYPLDSMVHMLVEVATEPMSVELVMEGKFLVDKFLADKFLVAKFLADNMVLVK